MTRFAYIIIILMFTTTFQQAYAQPETHFIQLAASSQQNLDAAVQRVKKETGGRILSARTTNKNGQAIHHIKVLLPSGKVRTFKIKN